MDRRAEFQPNVREFLDSHSRVKYEVQERRRFRDESGKFAYTHSEWKEVIEPSWRMEAVPQTLTEADLRNDVLPAPMYVIKFDDGKTLRSKIQATRTYHAHGLVVDFMTLVDNDNQEIEAFNWSDDAIANYVPNVQSRGRGATLRLNEPEVAGVGGMDDRGRNNQFGQKID